VVAGETVALLAARYNIAADAIRSANRVVRHSPRLVPGTMLYLPLTTGIPGWMLRESDPPRGTVAASRTVISRSGGGATYAVESGETLSGIAEANGTTVAAILSANHMSSGDVLKAGQQLVIPGARAVSAGPHGAAAIVSPPASSMAASPVPPAHTGRRVIVGTTGTTHVVKAGETVGGIATDYGIAQSALVALNHLGKAAKITIGQILKIPPR
jgi:LysM repeat protein